MKLCKIKILRLIDHVMQDYAGRWKLKLCGSEKLLTSCAFFNVFGIIVV